MTQNEYTSMSVALNARIMELKAQNNALEAENARLKEQCKAYDDALLVLMRLNKALQRPNEQIVHKGT